MLRVETPAALLDHVGEEIGLSDWLTVDQALIDRFADLTGDDQWIHVDVDRAKREMPEGKTIAHGLLTLALVPGLAKGQLAIDRLRMSVNYGLNRVRFTAPTPVGARIRLRSTIKAAEARPDGGVMLTTGRVVEIEGADRPAMVAEGLTLLYGA